MKGQSCRTLAQLCLGESRCCRGQEPQARWCFSWWMPCSALSPASPPAFEPKITSSAIFNDLVPLISLSHLTFFGCKTLWGHYSKRGSQSWCCSSALMPRLAEIFAKLSSLELKISCQRPAIVWFVLRFSLLFWVKLNQVKPFWKEPEKTQTWWPVCQFTVAPTETFITDFIAMSLFSPHFLSACRQDLIKGWIKAARWSKLQPDSPCSICCRRREACGELKRKSEREPVNAVENQPGKKCL